MTRRKKTKKGKKERRKNISSSSLLNGEREEGEYGGRRRGHLFSILFVGEKRGGGSNRNRAFSDRRKVKKKGKGALFLPGQEKTGKKGLEKGGKPSGVPPPASR